MVLFDFSKSFDVVSHYILIKKSKLLGVTGSLLNWISDFLTSRTMNVSVSGTCSSSREVKSGVLKGSVLGSLLFLIFVNYLPSYIWNNCKFFADDLKFYLKIRHSNILDLATDTSSCQRDIDVEYWVAEYWGLSFKPGKCIVLRCQRGNIDHSIVGSLQY